MIYIASDHGGFKLKGYIVTLLKSQNLDVTDLGAKVLNPQDDYVDFAKKLARTLVNSKQKTARLPARQEGQKSKVDVGILLCRSGQGVCMAVNRYKGVRGALAWNIKSAKVARHDDWANVLCLPADFISRSEAEKIVQVFLNTPWGKEPRRARRVKKLEKQ